MKVAVRKSNGYDLKTVKESLRAALGDLGMESENPLSGVVNRGQTVFIKPNWVAHRYRASCPRQDSIWSTITHPNVILAVADFVAEALQGEGRITIGDNPSIDADFDELISVSDLKSVTSRYDVECELVDLRPLVCEDLKDYGIKERMTRKPGDPRGCVKVDLGDESALNGLDPEGFRGVFDDRAETIHAHSDGRHEYEISASIANADVYISIPKMKTHHKVGTTLNLKGLVGTVTNKNQLVHWRVGYPEVGGDEYPDKATFDRTAGERVQKRGAWPGNDTIWRMVVDLYAALERVRAGRRSLTIVDGIVGGQGEGPFCPTAKNARRIVASEDLLAADLVTTRLMGFDVHAVPYLEYYLRSGSISLSDINVISEGASEAGFFGSNSRYLEFDAPESWKGMEV